MLFYLVGDFVVCISVYVRADLCDCEIVVCCHVGLVGAKNEANWCARR